ncbi:MAG: hypothetical protein GX951_03645, partial [Mollicutes bacterium]|nr:hypothetical protein [Mollicutes bacterium]
MKKTSLRSEIINIVLEILGIYLVLLLILWFGNKEIFWSWVYWGTGIFATITFLFILSKKQNKKRKDNLIKDIERLSLKDNVNNFINRAGMEKGRYAWKYVNYGFNRDKMNIFLRTLKEDGLKIKNMDDLEYILTHFINKKEESLLRGGINNDQKYF